ncbi:hypothetical protein AB1N83_012672 [Pleurotus pulmonarius]
MSTRNSTPSVQSGVKCSQASIIALSLETMFYGIHIVLFSAAIYIARHRRIKLYFAPVIVAIFTFSTVRAGIDIWKLILLASTGDVTENVDIPVAILHATNNALANGLMVYQGCMIFRSRWATYSFCILSSASAICGYVFPLSMVYFIVAMVTQIIVTSLCAKRIWATYQGTSEFTTMGPPSLKKVMYTVTESGAIYSLCLLALALSLAIGGENPGSTKAMKLPDAGPAFAIAYAITSQAVGIAPTMIIIRTWIGSREPLPLSPVSTLQFSPKHADKDKLEKTCDSMSYISLPPPAEAARRCTPSPCICYDPRESWHTRE